MAEDVHALEAERSTHGRHFRDEQLDRPQRRIRRARRVAAANLVVQDHVAFIREALERLEAEVGTAGPAMEAEQRRAGRLVSAETPVPRLVAAERNTAFLDGRHDYSGVTYAAVRPPSTRNVDAFTYDDSSLARKSAAFTISRGFAILPIGTWTRRRSAAPGVSLQMRSKSGVSTGPGHSALTRTPCRANCTPSSLLIESTAPFDAVYEICDVAAPTSATNDATLITEPPPRSSKCGMPYLQQTNTPRVLTACTRSHASRPVSRIESSSAGEMPALL